MPVTFQVGGIKDEQARGPSLNSADMSLFALRASDPTNLLYLGGHRVNDAPSAETVEGTTSTTRSTNPLTGKHEQTTRRLSPTTIQALTTNILPPTKFLPRIGQIRKIQNTDRIHYLLKSAIVSADAEERFAYVLQNGVLDDWTFTTGVSQWGEDAAEVERQYPLVSEGQALAYEALQATEIEDAIGTPLYAAAYVQNLETGINPHQNFAVGGGVVATPTSVGFRTSNQFGSTTGFTFTTINAALNGTIMDMLHYNGNYLFAIADAYKAISGDGGVAFSNGTAEAAIPASIASSLGIHALAELNGIIYAFGNAGEGWKSCDGGLTWEAIVTGITEHILCADVDRFNNRIYLGCSNAEAYVYNLSAFVEITGGTRFVPTVAQDLMSVAVVGDDQVLYGSEDGFIYESNEAYAGDYSVSYTGGANPVRALHGDGRNLRCVAGVGTTIVVRDILNNQTWEVVATAGGGITSIVQGDEYPDEGLGFFLITTLTGEVYKLDSYYPFSNVAC